MLITMAYFLLSREMKDAFQLLIAQDDVRLGSLIAKDLLHRLGS